MSMTEHLGGIAVNLTPDDIAARFERIRGLARAERRAAAIRKAGLKNATPKDAQPAHRMKPSKARKPYFYNPSNRD